MAQKRPSYDIAKILRLKRMLDSNDDIDAFHGAILVGDDFAEFVELLRYLLTGVARDVVQDTCLNLLGSAFTPEARNELSWRISGNMPRLRRGQAVQPWDGQASYEWVPVQVVDWATGASRQGKPGAWFDFRVLAGRPAGHTIQQFWTTSYCYTFAGRMGFSRWTSGKYPFRDFRQLADLRLTVRIVPGAAQLTFDQLAFPSSALDWNARLIKRRSRLEFQCPRDYPQEHYCHLCHVGRDNCPAAVHPMTYIQRACSQCQQPGWFDADGEVCVNCVARNAIKLKRREN